MSCNDGNTKMHKDAKAGNMDEIVKAVLAGADTSVKNAEGKTPGEEATDPSITAALNAPGSFSKYVKNRPHQDFSKADFHETYGQGA